MSRDHGLRQVTIELRPRVLGRLAADATLIGILLFGFGGTLAWWRAWVLVAVLLFVRMAGAVIVSRVNPDLARDRATLPLHRDQPLSDRLLVFAILATGFVALPVVAALDVQRWHVLRPPLPSVAALGLVLFVCGWTLKAFVLRENAFATSTVRVQRERQHAVVDSGVYRIARHPFYAGTLLVLIGMCLWLESYLATLLAAVPIVLVVTRLALEERFLRRSLPGYSEYTRRVKYRLVPGVW